MQILTFCGFNTLQLIWTNYDPFSKEDNVLGKYCKYAEWNLASMANVWSETMQIWQIHRGKLFKYGKFVEWNLANMAKAEWNLANMAKALSKFGKYAEGNLASTVNTQSET